MSGENIQYLSDDVDYGNEGDQWFCRRGDFVNLQESCCGFGNTQEEAYKDLLRQETEESL